MARAHFQLTGRAAFRGVQVALLMPLVEAIAELVRDEIVAVMESASPSGRTYRIPGTTATYTASAPGEPPAIREGIYRDSWEVTPAIRHGRTVRAGVFNTERVGAGIPLWIILEFGTSDQVNFRVRMAPRPHVRVAVDRVRPKARRLIRRARAA